MTRIQCQCNLYLELIIKVKAEILPNCSPRKEQNKFELKGCENEEKEENLSTSKSRLSFKNAHIVMNPDWASIWYSWRHIVILRCDLPSHLGGL